MAGRPLGLLTDVAYDRLVVNPQSGDLIVLDSDGVSEASNTNGNELGRDGLINMVRALDSSSTETLGSQLASALDLFRGAVKRLNDETIIVMRKNDI